jgi:hypothetical protein
MCLGINHSVEVCFDEKGWVEAYKAADEDGHPPYQPNTCYEEGEMVSSRERVTLSEEEIRIKEVEHGFHVLLQEEDACSLAQEKADNSERTHQVIRVRGHRDHFVAAGYWSTKESAVFTRLIVPEDHVVRVCEPEERCEHCGCPLDYCECETCPYCSEKEDDCECETCSCCGDKKEECSCPVCPHCEEKEYDCSCCFCATCDELEADCVCENEEEKVNDVP